MARTPSNMLPLGTKAPNFNLIDVTNNTTVSLDNLKGEVGTMIMFICNHCPFVKHVNHTLASMVMITMEIKLTLLQFQVMM